MSHVIVVQTSAVCPCLYVQMNYLPNVRGLKLQTAQYINKNLSTTLNRVLNDLELDLFIEKLGD